METDDHDTQHLKNPSIWMGMAAGIERNKLSEANRERADAKNDNKVMQRMKIRID